MPFQIAGALIHGGNIAVHREFAGTEADGRLWGSQQKIRQARDRLLLRVRQPLTVVEGEIMARRLGIGVDVLEQARADVQFL